MTDQELYENSYAIGEMLLKNAAHSFGLDFAVINETMIELQKRIRANSVPIIVPKPEPMIPKLYKCTYCGRSKMIETNHYGECYGQLGMNECPACSNERPGTPTIWECQEKEPEHGICGDDGDFSINSFKP